MPDEELDTTEPLEPSDDETDTTEPSEEEPEEPSEKVYTQDEILDSVLLSVKENLGIYIQDKDFDTQLIFAINSSFSQLHQMGVGPNNPYKVKDENDKWIDFTSNDERLEMVKEYIPQKVRLLFDPPTSSFLLEATKNIISEMEWRLYILAQTDEDEESNEQLEPPTNNEEEQP